MIWRLAIAIAVVLIAVAAAHFIRARRPSDVPTQARGQLPGQLDRSDFEHAGRDWLVVVFTSDTCSTCADVVAKAAVLASEQVGVQIASWQRDKDLHQRYEIDSVPAVLMADPDGVVQRSFIGPVTASDLWHALAEARA